MADQDLSQYADAPRTASAIAPRHARVVVGPVPGGRRAYWISGRKTLIIPRGYEVCGRGDAGAEYACSLVYDGRGVEFGICRSTRTHSYRNVYIRKID